MMGSTANYLPIKQLSSARDEIEYRDLPKNPTLHLEAVVDGYHPDVISSLTIASRPTW